MNYNNVVDMTIANNGGTFNINGECPTNGYCVAVKGYEKQIPVESFNVNDVESYIKNNVHTLSHDRSLHVGTWINEGIVYLDLTRVHSDVDTALQLARRTRELAIFCLSTFREIFV